MAKQVLPPRRLLAATVSLAGKDELPHRLSLNSKDFFDL
jgi:hypothetical protein